MVSPQVLLGLGIAAALLGIGGYVLWLWLRLDAFLDRAGGQVGGDAVEEDR